MTLIRCTNGDLEYECDFNLNITLNSGQNSRHRYAYSGFILCHAYDSAINADRSVVIKQLNETTLRVNITTLQFKDFWENYFDLQTDYNALLLPITHDTFSRQCLEHGKGLRIMKQDLWEVMVTFVVSQNNNIPNILNTIEKLVTYYGVDKQFPTPRQLLDVTPESLQHFTRCGYRARYILSAAHCMTQGMFEDLEYDDYNIQLQTLLKINGVGMKVANCIILFGLHNTSAFPIDVWIQRIINKEYKGCIHEIAKSSYAGIIQQYMFYYALTHKQKYM